MFEKWPIRIAAVCVFVFLLQISMAPLTDGIALVSAEVLFRPWTLVTSMFAHGSFTHLFYNMFALILFGLILEKIIGDKKFLIIYFAAGITGSIATIPLYTASLGASGAIFGILGALAVLRPKTTVYISYVPMPMIVAAGVWAMMDFVGLFAPNGTANSAHLAGLAVGLLAGLYLKKEYGEKHPPRRRPVHISEAEIRDWEDRWLSR